MQLNFNMITKVNELIADGQKFDVVHAHDWLTTFSAKTIKNSYNIPLVSTIHATEAGRNSGIHTYFHKFASDVLL